MSPLFDVSLVLCGSERQNQRPGVLLDAILISGHYIALRRPVRSQSI